MSGGLAAPTFELYELSAQLLEWNLDDPNLNWVSAEAAGIGSIPLRNLLYVIYKVVYFNQRQHNS